jgi:hypothetical protein
MFLLTASLSASLLGCAGDPPEQAEPDETGDTAPVTLPPLGDDEGSLVVLSWLPSAGRAPLVAKGDARTVMLGMFARSREGIVNLAQCVGSSESFCAEALPAAPGDSVVVTEMDPLILEDLRTVYVGEEVRLGPWSAPYESDSGVGYYRSTEPGAALPTEPVALTLDGEWAPYASEPVIPVPTPIEVTSPDPALEFDLHDSAPLDLRWVPAPTGATGAADAGAVYLAVSTTREERLFLLEDDGQEWIDLSPLGLAEGAAVDMILGRWTVTPIDHRGHDLQLQIQSNQQLFGTWRTTGPRVELTELYDDCAAAEAAPGVSPGNYTGDLYEASPDLDPGTGGCTGFQARGPDAVVPIDLLAEELLTVNYQLLADDASLYLVTDCTDEVGTCLVGSDVSQNGGAVEQAVYLNATGGPQRVYAVLDSFLGVTERFNLDILIESIGGDVLVPTCIEAMDQGPIGSGNYRGSLAVHADLLAPECAGTSEGGEGMLQVYLEPGGTVQATASSAGTNPVVYLMYHCAIAESCFYAENDESGDSEELRYTNTTGVAEFFYLVVDGDTNLGDYELDLTVQ